MASQEQNNIWAIVSLMGHKTLAGRITKDTSLFPLLRVDVPATSAAPEFSAEYSPSAIYEILYVSEEIARATANRIKADPIRVYCPELVTREMYEEMREIYQKKLSDALGLPPGSVVEDDEELPF